MRRTTGTSTCRGNSWCTSCAYRSFRSRIAPFPSPCAFALYGHGTRCCTRTRFLTAPTPCMWADSSRTSTCTSCLPISLPPPSRSLRRISIMYWTDYKYNSTCKNSDRLCSWYSILWIHSNRIINFMIMTNTRMLSISQWYKFLIVQYMYSLNPSWIINWIYWFCICSIHVLC